MNAAAHKFLSIAAFSIFSILLLARPVLAAQDCQINPRVSLPSQYQCAVAHADFLFENICANQDPCEAKNADVIKAYKQASSLFDERQPIHEDWLMRNGTNADLERSARVAQQSAILNNRARELVKASNSFVTCVELADRAYGHTGANEDKLLRESCAASNIVLVCAADPTRAGCTQSGPVTATFAIITKVYRGHVSSASGDDPLETPQPPARTIDTLTQMPDRKAIQDLSNGMSNEERRAILNGVGIEHLRIKSVDSSQ